MRSLFWGLEMRSLFGDVGSEIASGFGSAIAFGYVGCDRCLGCGGCDRCFGNVGCAFGILGVRSLLGM